jgi:hydrogenase-1 operon protein HyaF
MSGLDNIPVNVEAPAMPFGSGNTGAILAELETSLRTLLKSGKEHSIDLRSLPLLPGELDYLRERLGTGEVQVDVNALGHSTVVETAIRGVWWVTHRNAVDNVMAEFLEVSFCPDIIRAQRDDVRESLEVLGALLAGDNHS